MGRDVIIACDFSSEEATLKFLDNFKEEKPYVKIGMELYYAAGADMVRKLKERGHKIFPTQLRSLWLFFPAST